MYIFIVSEGILGYDDYYISNKGRVKKYSKRVDDFYLLLPRTNGSSERLYVKIQGKGLQISRLVGFAYVSGYSENNNTIDHIDGDVTNNDSMNLQWVSQSENNYRAYENGRKASIAHSKNGKFSKIILDDKYEFKTIVALAKFLNISPTQTQRYISGETEYNGKIEFIY